MKKEDAISLFGNAPKLAKALGIKKQAVYQWPDELRQRTADEVRGAYLRIKLGREPDIVEIFENHEKYIRYCTFPW